MIDRPHHGALPRGILADEPALSPGATDALTRAIERVLEGMPETQRRVIALRLARQLPTPAIAAALGLSERAVRAHLARATRDLRAQLPAVHAAIAAEARR